jgi:hypothetical protein
MSPTVSSNPLSEFQGNVYSQHGEDGVIEEILNRISRTTPLDGWCVEFGAWDGIHLSNSYNLVRNRNYKAVLIEGDRVRYMDLCKNLPSPDIIKVCQFVTFSGESTLDCILNKTPIPTDFDFLSIDIDGCDYYILESLTAYHPKLICIEFNPTIPNDVEFIQPKDFSIKQGSSAKSLLKLATMKGYSLVAVTTCNLFFVRNQYKDSIISAANSSLHHFRDDADVKCYLFCGYDGTVLSNIPLRMPWHGLQIEGNSLQKLPKFLRRFPGDYNRIQKIAFAVFLAFSSPKRLWKRLTGTR